MTPGKVTTMAMSKTGRAPRVAQALDISGAEDKQAFLNGYADGLRPSEEVVDLRDKHPDYAAGFKAATLVRANDQSMAGSSETEA